LFNNIYHKCNFMIILCKGKYSRVWDLKEEFLIKKASDDDDRKKSREIIANLDYNEAVKIISSKTKTKKLNKGGNIFVNVIPYIEYYCKYEIEKKGNIRVFKPVSQEAPFWLRIFSSDDIYLNELPRPFE